MGKLTNNQTKQAKAVFDKEALCDVMGPDELTSALEEIGGPEWACWTGAAEWVDEFDSIGCGELDVDCFLKLLVEKDVYNSDGPPMDDLDALLDDDDDLDAILDSDGEDAANVEAGGMTKDQIEKARDAFNDADEELAAMIGADALHFALCQINETAFLE